MLFNAIISLKTNYDKIYMIKEHSICCFPIVSFKCFFFILLTSNLLYSVYNVMQNKKLIKILWTYEFSSSDKYKTGHNTQI